jgi:hypothetical protein
MQGLAEDNTPNAVGVFARKAAKLSATSRGTRFPHLLRECCHRQKPRTRLRVGSESQPEEKFERSKPIVGAQTKLMF